MVDDENSKDENDDNEVIAVSGSKTENVCSRNPDGKARVT